MRTSPPPADLALASEVGYLTRHADDRGSSREWAALCTAEGRAVVEVVTRDVASRRVVRCDVASAGVALDGPLRERLTAVLVEVLGDGRRGAGPCWTASGVLQDGLTPEQGPRVAAALVAALAG